MDLTLTFARRPLLGSSWIEVTPSWVYLVQMWLRKQPQKRPLKDEATPPPGYASAPPGYRYWSPKPSSSPNYYRKRLEPEEAPNSSRRSFRRRVLSIVLIAILAVDLLAMFYGGYLSSWQLLTQPSGILWAAVGLIALIGLLASAYEKIFSPGVRRTISRNAPLVSALIALIGVLITQIVNTHLTRTTQENQQLLDQEARQNSELQSYLSALGELPSNPDPAADTAAQAQTLTVLPHLDPEQKRTVMQFLYQANLINKDNPRIRLFYADLTSANLKGTDAQENKFVLDNAYLRGVNLGDADLEYISMKGVNLHPARLVNTNLSNADLSDADLVHAYLDNVDLSGSTLSGTNLSGVDLRTDKGLTQEQIEEAKGDERTQLPDGLQRPASWS
jgi:uncharacterized protein YjbI with pentapeptide repeats